MNKKAMSDFWFENFGNANIGIDRVCFQLEELALLFHRLGQETVAFEIDDCVFNIRALNELSYKAVAGHMNSEVDKSFAEMGKIFNLFLDKADKIAKV